MNTPDTDRELLEAYRRASAAEAGAPGEAVRKAILAEATAAADRRRPAANEARYWYGAAASFAVIGIALILWRQMPDPLATDATVAVPYQAELAAEKPADATSPAEAPPAGSPAVAQSARAPVPPAPEPPGPEPFPVPPEARREVAPPPPVALTQRAQADAAERAAQDETSAAARVAAPSPQLDLLRRHFPAEYASEVPPRGVWFVEDDAGNVLRSGVLAEGQSFATLTPALERELGGLRLGPWRAQSVPNARGQPVEVGIARVQ